MATTIINRFEKEWENQCRFLINKHTYLTELQVTENGPLPEYLADTLSLLYHGSLLIELKSTSILKSSTDR